MDGVPSGDSKSKDVSSQSPEDLISGLRTEMGLGRKDPKASSKSAESMEVSLSPEENTRRRKAQSEAIDRAVKKRTEILEKAGVWTGNYIDEDEIQNALKPTLDELRGSAPVLDYLAFKSMYDIGSHFIGNTISLNSILGEDEQIIERAKKEVLAEDQRLKLEGMIKK